MNLKKIAGMCKSAGVFHVQSIVNDAGEVVDQWVILGGAAYRIDNMGLTANMLARFAGVKDTQTVIFLKTMQTGANTRPPSPEGWA